MDKNKVITSLQFMIDRPPSKWDAPLIIKFKDVLKVAKEMLEGKEEFKEPEDLETAAKEIFNV